MARSRTLPGKQAPCPNCRGPAEWDGNPNRPFCSPRCKSADLHNWMSNSYVIPGEPVRREQQEDEDAAAPD